MKKCKLINLSTYRKQIMGVAIVFIMLCHNSLQFNSSLDVINSIAKQFMQIGVDIFLFMSGMGCYYSLCKTNDIKLFYTKRIIKIFVPYILIIGVWGLVQLFLRTTNGIKGFVYLYSLITFFTHGELSEWYIAGIIVLYAISPFFYKLLNSRKKVVNIAVIIIWLVAAFGFSMCGIIPNERIVNVIRTVNEIFVVRVPVFLIGLILGKRMYDNAGESFDRKVIAAVAGLSLLMFLLNVTLFSGNAFILSKYFITRTLFAPICVSFSLGMGELFGVLDQKGAGGVKRLAEKLGAITLELYLIHEKVLFACELLITNRENKAIFSCIWVNGLAILLSLALASGFHWWILKIENKLWRKIVSKR